LVRHCSGTNQPLQMATICECRSRCLRIPDLNPLLRLSGHPISDNRLCELAPSCRQYCAAACRRWEKSAFPQVGIGRSHTTPRDGPVFTHGCHQAAAASSALLSIDRLDRLAFLAPGSTTEPSRAKGRRSEIFVAAGLTESDARCAYLAVV